MKERKEVEEVQEVPEVKEKSGSMAAFASWNSKKQPEKISRGLSRAGFFRLDRGLCGGCSGRPPCARSASISDGRM